MNSSMMRVVSAMASSSESFIRWKGKYPSEEDIREVMNDAMGSNDEEEEQEKE